MEVAEEAPAVEVERVWSDQPRTQPGGIVHAQELEGLPVDGRLAALSAMPCHGKERAKLC